jgi:hypothetical protein
MSGSSRPFRVSTRWRGDTTNSANRYCGKCFNDTRIVNLRPRGSRSAQHRQHVATRTSEDMSGNDLGARNVCLDHEIGSADDLFLPAFRSHRAVADAAALCTPCALRTRLGGPPPSNPGRNGRD